MRLFLKTASESIYVSFLMYNGNLQETGTIRSVFFAAFYYGQFCNESIYSLSLTKLRTAALYRVQQ